MSGFLDDDDDSEDMFDGGDSDDDGEIGEIAPLKQFAEAAQSAVRRVERTTKSEPKSGRTLRMRPMTRKMLERYPDVTTITMTRNDGRQLIFVRK